MSLPELVNGVEAADILGVSNKTVSRWVEAGKLPQPQRVGSMLTFRKSDIEAVKNRMDKVEELRRRADELETANASASENGPDAT